jgi:hypothetical protein
MATAAMCRKAVEDIAKEKKAKDGKLWAMIDDLFSQGIITIDLKDAAHEVRHLGNDGVHEGGGEEEAAEAIEFVENLIQYIYILRENIRLRREKRQAGKAGGSTPPSESVRLPSSSQPLPRQTSDPDGVLSDPTA